MFYPMFFRHDKSFEEFYCICIQTLNKTWREMRASTEDFTKVCTRESIVLYTATQSKEQISRVLEYMCVEVGGVYVCTIILCASVLDSVGIKCGQRADVERPGVWGKGCLSV
jgi:hypothetical protein